MLYADYGHGKARSGMAQGLAISIWCRAFVETNKHEYLRNAHEAFNSFTLDIEEGGVVDHIGYPILQEWVNERNHILNGHLFAFAGIVDLLRIEPDETKRSRLKMFYDLYLASSLKMIAQSDLRFWTRYSLRPSSIPNIASYFYHDLHIEMLQGLRHLIGSHDFDTWISRWKRQQKQPLFQFTAMIMKLMDRMYTEWTNRAGRLPS
ncbi:MAG: D-glucuronyl C5-epimerase family protein [Candidatus Latescibacteria bacterium]|nr:D-glucuronyl C5-epimerase family protein [Candidatus Latescibacterota bacterium]